MAATEMLGRDAAVGGSAQSLPGGSRGSGSWLRGYARTLAWDLAELRLQLPVLAAVLILQGAGFVLGIGLIVHQIPESAALFVSTGVPVVNLITAGLILEPQLIANHRETGSYEFLQSLPVPRSATALAWYTVTLLISVPAAAISVVTAALRYSLHFTITPAIIPAVLVTSLLGMLLGYAIGHAVSSPMVTRLVSAMLIFVIFGFSPIMFPALQLPSWLASANEWLPFGSMATIMRSALASGMDTGVSRAYLVVLAWMVVSALVAAWAVTRRR